MQSSGVLTVVGSKTLLDGVTVGAELVSPSAVRADLIDSIPSILRRANFDGPATIIIDPNKNEGKLRGMVMQPAADYDGEIEAYIANIADSMDDSAGLNGETFTLDAVDGVHVSPGTWTPGVKQSFDLPEKNSILRELVIPRVLHQYENDVRDPENLNESLVQVVKKRKYSTLGLVKAIIKTCETDVRMQIYFPRFIINEANHTVRVILTQGGGFGWHATAAPAHSDVLTFEVEPPVVTEAGVAEPEFVS